MFSIITELDLVKEILHRDIVVTASDPESLLVAWLNELIYLFDTENILFKRFDVSVVGNTRLEARGYGEKVDTLRHQLKTGIKAATYHMLSVDQSDGYQVRVILDI